MQAKDSDAIVEDNDTSAAKLNENSIKADPGFGGKNIFVVMYLVHC